MNIQIHLILHFVFVKFEKQIKLTFRESTKSSTKKRRLSSFIAQFTWPRVELLYFWINSSDIATSESKNALENKTHTVNDNYLECISKQQYAWTYNLNVSIQKYSVLSWKSAFSSYNVKIKQNILHLICTISWLAQNQVYTLFACFRFVYSLHLLGLSPDMLRGPIWCSN